ncbi:MAG: polyhydroxybutyrate depolymerase, partial [Deltaproteobacteria bacterium]|nr:polyhydroxybutyrate depolymerase [Kofleriaceae bacterium]
MRRVVPWLLLAACGGGADDGPADRPMTFGGDRPVQLQVPSDFAEDRTYPVVMILHGYGANGFIQQTFLGLADLASTHDVLVLAPDGTVDGTGKQFWNAGASWCDVTACPDDVAYLGGVLDDVLATWPVDPARVSLVGHSNGHFMSYRMMCDRADVVTAIAGLAGLGPVDPCAPSQPVHALHMHGTADAVVPYDGGAWGGATVPSAVE